MTATTAGHEAAETLAATSAEGLLTAFASLTHRIDAVQLLSAADWRRLADLRTQRDMVRDEILRRMG